MDFIYYTNVRSIKGGNKMGRNSKTAERRAEILGHLIHQLNKEGLEGVTFAKISKRMGVNKSLVAHYFESKEEMMVALADHIIERYRQTYDRMFEGVTDPAQRLDIFLDTIINLDWEIGDEISDIVYYSCFYLRFKNEKISNRLTELYAFIKAVYMEELTRYRDAGILNIADPEQAAVFILSLSEGCYYYSTVMGNRSRDKIKISNMRGLVLQVLKSEIPIF